MPFLFLLFYVGLNFAQDQYPEYYRYQILVGDPTTSTVTQESFESIPQIIYALHFQELQEAKKTVEVRADWVKPNFTAWANLEGADFYTLNFWGGLARIPGMTDHGHALVACHELGHILGGDPKIRIENFRWSSAEGQSDYYASSKCLPRYFAFKHQMQKLNILRTLPETLFTRCRMRFNQELDFLICLHTLKAINDFSNVLEHLSGDRPRDEVDLLTPSPKVVEETIFNSYPEKQCRVDTMVQGTFKLNRPSCWFR